MAALCYVPLKRILEEDMAARVIANQWAFATPSGTDALRMWYPYRCVEVNGDPAAPLAVGPVSCRTSTIHTLSKLYTGW